MAYRAARFASTNSSIVPLLVPQYCTPRSTRRGAGVRGIEGRVECSRQDPQKGGTFSKLGHNRYSRGILRHPTLAALRVLKLCCLFPTMHHALRMCSFRVVSVRCRECQYHHVSDQALCYRVAKDGRLDMLRWARETENPMYPWDVSTCWVAAQKGHLDVLQWAIDHGCPWNKDQCLKVATHHPAVVEWLTLRSN